jgi:hypothetical protein
MAEDRRNCGPQNPEFILGRVTFTLDLAAFLFARALLVWEF